MKIFIVVAHPERQSFNGAMFRTAVETLSAAGHEVRTSDLHAMPLDPVSGRHNFLAAKDPDYFKQQIEEMHAIETNGFALAPQIVYGPVRLQEEERTGLLAAYAARLKNIAGEIPIDVGIY